MQGVLTSHVLVCFYTFQKSKKMPFNEAQWIFSFFESDFLTNTNPVSAQLLAIVYPTILSLFSKPDRLPKPEEGFQDYQKSQKLLNPVHLVQKSLGQGSHLPK